MNHRIAIAALLFGVGACSALDPLHDPIRATLHVASAQTGPEPKREIESPRSGVTFNSRDVQQLQDDDAANPGMLWVAQGKQLWNEPAGADQKSCASCHGDAAKSMRGVAAGYPVYDAGEQNIVNIEGRINQCRTKRQHADALRYESDPLLSLTAYVAHESRGMPVTASIAGPARPHFDAGRANYVTRQGQLNVSCAQCHEKNWGRTLLAEPISQGQSNGYPAYRFEWQAMGSLHRRLRACQIGIRAEQSAPGSQELLDLELYLAWRAEGLPIEAPGVRR
ncbi:MAG: sulfur oxidation c-type cytochrome SoxA [Betaproteobacteria bacterium]